MIVINNKHRIREKYDLDLNQLDSIASMLNSTDKESVKLGYSICRNLPLCKHFLYSTYKRFQIIDLLNLETSIAKSVLIEWLFCHTYCYLAYYIHGNTAYYRDNYNTIRLYKSKIKIKKYLTH